MQNIFTPTAHTSILHMLRLRQSLRCRMLGVRGVKSWHKDLDAPLKRVGARIDAALQVQSTSILPVVFLSSILLNVFRLQELAALRPKSVEWCSHPSKRSHTSLTPTFRRGVAFEAVRNINSAPSRHLIRPQLVRQTPPAVALGPTLLLRRSCWDTRRAAARWTAQASRASLPAWRCTTCSCW